MRFVPLVVVFALAVTLQLVVVPLAGPFYGKLIVDIGINVMLAVSLNIVNGLTGQFSIGHAGFMAVGAYVAAVISYYGALRFWGSAAAVHDVAHLTLFAMACITGGLVASLFGFAVGLPSLRLRGDYLAIVTLGFGEIARVVLQRSPDVLTDAASAHTAGWRVVADVGGALGFTGLPFYTSALWVYVFCGITVLVAYRLKASTYGRAFLAIRENEIAAEAMGIRTTRYKVQAFVIAAFFAGIAGALFAHTIGITLNPRELGFQKSFDIVIMVVLGGMGSISGSVIAAIVLTLLPEGLRGFADYRLIVYALTLVVVMIARPRGLLGVAELWELPWARR